MRKPRINVERGRVAVVVFGDGGEGVTLAKTPGWHGARGHYPVCGEVTGRCGNAHLHFRVSGFGPE